jgi:hypothetical protein
MFSRESCLLGRTDENKKSVPDGTLFILTYYDLIYLYLNYLIPITWPTSPFPLPEAKTTEPGFF